MLDEKSKKWIEAAKILREDPAQMVLCPNCNASYLRVEDVIVPEKKKCDRYMVCDNCKEFNVITFNI